MISWVLGGHLFEQFLPKIGFDICPVLLDTLVVLPLVRYIFHKAHVQLLHFLPCAFHRMISSSIEE